MNAYSKCKEREHCFCVLLWPTHRGYEIRWDESTICKFALYQDSKCILRNKELKTYNRPKTISWDWPSCPSSDAGSNSKECKQVICKNIFYKKKTNIKIEDNPASKEEK